MTPSDEDFRERDSIRSQGMATVVRRGRHAIGSPVPLSRFADNAHRDPCPDPYIRKSLVARRTHTSLTRATVCPVYEFMGAHNVRTPRLPLNPLSPPKGLFRPIRVKQVKQLWQQRTYDVSVR